MKNRKLSRSVRDESLDLSGFLVIHCDVCSLPVLHCEIPILLNRREDAHVRGQGEKEGYQVLFKNNIGWYGMKQAMLFHSHVSFRPLQNFRTRQTRARREVSRECVCSEVFIRIPVLSLSISNTV